MPCSIAMLNYRRVYSIISVVDIGSDRWEVPHVEAFHGTLENFCWFVIRKANVGTCPHAFNVWTLWCNSPRFCQNCKRESMLLCFLWTIDCWVGHPWLLDVVGAWLVLLYLWSGLGCHATSSIQYLSNFQQSEVALPWLHRIQMFHVIPESYGIPNLPSSFETNTMFQVGVQQRSDHVANVAKLH